MLSLSSAAKRGAVEDVARRRAAFAVADPEPAEMRVEVRPHALAVELVDLEARRVRGCGAVRLPGERCAEAEHGPVARGCVPVQHAVAHVVGEVDDRGRIDRAEVDARVGRHGEVVGDDAEAGLGLGAMDAPTRAQGELRDLEGVGRAQHGRPAHAVGERRERVGRARSRQHQAEPPRGDGGKARGPSRDGVRRQLRDIPVLDAVVARLQHRGCRRRGAEAARSRQPHHDRAHRDGIVRTPARSRPSTSRRGPAAGRACGRTNRR